MLELKTQASDAFNELTKRPWELCGLGFYYAWTFVLFSRVDSFPTMGVIPIDRVSFYAIYSLSFIAIAALYHATERKVWAHFNDARYTRLIGPACMGLGTLILGFLPAVSIGAGFFIIAGILAGAGTAALLLSWGRFFAKIKSYRIVVHILLAFFIATILRWVVLEVPTELGIVLCALLPILSAIVLITSRYSEEHARVNKDSAQKNTLLKLIICLAVMSFLYGSVRNLSLFVPSLVSEDPYSHTVRAFIFLAMALMVTLMLHGPMVTRFYRVAMFAMIVGAAGICLNVESITQASLLTLSCGQYFFQGMIWMTSAYALVSASNKVLSTFALALLTSEIGALIGGTLTSATANAWPFPMDIEATFNALCVALVVVVCFVFMFLFKEKDMDIFAANRDQVLMSADEAIQLRCEEVSEQAGLTKREMEVLVFLVKGRSVPYISEKLTLSPSTIKTHVKHIYKKIDVHSKQELHAYFDSPTSTQ